MDDLQIEQLAIAIHDRYPFIDLGHARKLARHHPLLQRRLELCRQIWGDEKCHWINHTTHPTGYGCMWPPDLDELLRIVETHELDVRIYSAKK